MKPFNLKEFRAEQRAKAEAAGRIYEATTPKLKVDERGFVTVEHPPQLIRIPVKIFTAKD